MKARYEIRIRGLLGPLLRSSFGPMACETLPSQSTIHARLSADELHHLLERLNESGVEVVFLDTVPG